MQKCSATELFKKPSVFSFYLFIYFLHFFLQASLIVRMHELSVYMCMFVCAPVHMSVFVCLWCI